MKTIKIKFLGMGGRFNENNNFIVDILKKKYNVMISNDPDYVFYSVKTDEYLKYNCIRIFFTPENVVPDFNLCDYAIGFHYIDFEDRYFRYPLYLVDSFNAYEGDDYGIDLVRAEKKHEDVEEKIKQKTEFCSFVYSNKDAAPCRKMIFDSLCNYKKVNSGGGYNNNIGYKVLNKYEFQNKHKFVIAFENTSTSGYTTEKLVHAFAANAIPIYWGDPNVGKVFNENAFINCNSYALDENDSNMVLSKIIDRIIEIDQNDDIYLNMLRTPAFQNSYSICEEKHKFEEFLYNIFDQHQKNAQRRDHVLWGVRYERKEKIGCSAYNMCRKIIPVRDLILKPFKTRD